MSFMRVCFFLLHFVPFLLFFTHTKLFAIQSTFCFFPNRIICVCHYSVALILLLFGHNFSFSLTTSVLFIILLRFMARNIHTHRMHTHTPYHTIPHTHRTHRETHTIKANKTKCVNAEKKYE